LIQWIATVACTLAAEYNIHFNRSPSTLDVSYGYHFIRPSRHFRPAPLSLFRRWLCRAQVTGVSVDSTKPQELSIKTWSPRAGTYHTPGKEFPGTRGGV
jgi:hypothetical protein